MTARCRQYLDKHHKHHKPSMEGRSRDRPMMTVTMAALRSGIVLQWRGGHVTAR